MEAHLLYVRDAANRVVFAQASAPLPYTLPEVPFAFSALLASDTTTKVEGTHHGVTVLEACLQGTSGQALPVRIFEYRHDDEHDAAPVWQGVVQIYGGATEDGRRAIDPREAYMPSLMAARAHIAPWVRKLIVEKTQDMDAVVEALVDIFDNEYRHRPTKDQWETGRPKFVSKVRFFVERGLPLHMILPAFPCKSGNRSAKTLGAYPDKGEELALMSMEKIKGMMQAVYPPGCNFVIVSDGHVFSDLIGVDDWEVCEYGSVMRSMALKIFGTDNTIFHGLDDILHIEARAPFSNDATRFREYLPENVSVTLNQPLETKRMDAADDARRVMQYLFGTDPSKLEQKIKDDPTTTSLYRGFSRFLLDDIAMHPSVIAKASKNARKKLCGQLAFEMIQRNNSYSAMVELLFPLHLRISIHPHSNAGPKYGVNLIHPSFLIDTSSGNDNTCEDLHHIPTPWHNLVLENKDGKFTLMKHAQVSELKAEGARIELVYYADGRPSHYREIADSATSSTDSLNLSRRSVVAGLEGPMNRMLIHTKSMTMSGWM